MAVGDRNGILVGLVADQRLSRDLGTGLIADIEGRWRQGTHDSQIPVQPFSDRLALAAQPVALAHAALLFQPGVERLPCRKLRDRNVVFDPVHYLPLIEQKINSLDQAAPLQGWDLPEEFATLRRLMEGPMAKHGRREYVQVLRLLESFQLADLHAAVKQALHLGAIGFDAVKRLTLCRVERRPPRLDLSIYPYLPRATVETTSTKAYMRLLSSDAGEAA